MADGNLIILGQSYAKVRTLQNTYVFGEEHPYSINIEFENKIFVNVSYISFQVFDECRSHDKILFVEIVFSNFIFFPIIFTLLEFWFIR